MDNLTPEQIQAMIQMLQGMLPSVEKTQIENTDTNNHQETDDEDFVVKSIKTKRRHKKEKHTNKFNSMPEKNLHKEDTIIDKKLRTQPSVPRARKFSMIKVVCRVCGRREEVSPGLIQDSVDRYKCNKCSTSAG
jgi:hypothetical protein